MRRAAPAGDATPLRLTFDARARLTRLALSRFPSGAILLWEIDEAVPLQEMAVSKQTNPYHITRFLLDGQQRLTSLSAVIRGESVKERGRKKPIEVLFNLDHPDHPVIVSEVEEGGTDHLGLLARVALSYVRENAVSCPLHVGMPSQQLLH